VQRLACRAGIEGQISPPSLQQTFATITLNKGLCTYLQDSMGHADPWTTKGTTGHGTTC
jgi:integrase/recombinase XerD